MLSIAMASILADLIIKGKKKYSEVHEEDKARVNAALISKGHPELIPGLAKDDGEETPPDGQDEPSQGE